jgi:hypothetical protein
MTDLEQVFAHSPSVVSRKTGNSYVLVPVTNNIADMTSVYTLNETGSFIWEQIDGSRSLREITMQLTREYDIDYESAEKDVLEFVEHARQYLVIMNM